MSQSRDMQLGRIIAADALRFDASLKTQAVPTQVTNFLSQVLPEHNKVAVLYAANAGQLETLDEAASNAIADDKFRGGGQAKFVMQLRDRNAEIPEGSDVRIAGFPTSLFGGENSFRYNLEAIKEDMQALTELTEASDFIVDDKYVTSNIVSLDALFERLAYIQDLIKQGYTIVAFPSDNTIIDGEGNELEQQYSLGGRASKYWCDTSLTQISFTNSQGLKKFASQGALVDAVLRTMAEEERTFDFDEIKQQYTQAVNSNLANLIKKRELLLGLIVAKFATSSKSQIEMHVNELRLGKRINKVNCVSVSTVLTAEDKDLFNNWVEQLYSLNTEIEKVAKKNVDRFTDVNRPIADSIEATSGTEVSVQDSVLAALAKELSENRGATGGVSADELFHEMSQAFLNVIRLQAGLQIATQSQEPASGTAPEVTPEQLITGVPSHNGQVLEGSTEVKTVATTPKSQEVSAYQTLNMLMKVAAIGGAVTFLAGLALTVTALTLVANPALFIAGAVITGAGFGALAAGGAWNVSRRCGFFGDSDYVEPLAPSTAPVSA